MCGMACADILTDPANCGACRKKCKAKQSCVLGLCL
jgi:hypothetical protein